ncbi:MAG: hypothetical protein R3B09_28040, partial [Nannocystaceae bacterium]
MHVEDGAGEALARLAEERERVGPGAHRDRPHAPRREVGLEDLAVGRVVVDDQDPRVGEGRVLALEVARAHVGREGAGDGEAEGRPDADLALDRDLPAHRLDQALADREAEAGAAVAAGRRRVLLDEGGEEPRQRLGLDPAAGVADGALDLDLLLAAGPRGDADEDLALARELEGVADQVDERLLEPGRVAVDRHRHLGVDPIGELDPLLGGGHREDLDRGLDALADAHRHPLDLELAGLDLREVEDVVEEAEERLAAGPHQLGERALLRVEVGLEEEPGHADHRVHRRPDLVAHVGEELALGGARPGRLALGRLGDRERLLEARVRPRPLGLEGDRDRGDDDQGGQGADDLHAGDAPGRHGQGEGDVGEGDDRPEEPADPGAADHHRDQRDHLERQEGRARQAPHLRAGDRDHRGGDPAEEDPERRRRGAATDREEEAGDAQPEGRRREHQREVAAEDVVDDRDRADDRQRDQDPDQDPGATERIAAG